MARKRYLSWKKKCLRKRIPSVELFALWYRAIDFIRQRGILLELNYGTFCSTLLFTRNVKNLVSLQLPLEQQNGTVVHFDRFLSSSSSSVLKARDIARQIIIVIRIVFFFLIIFFAFLLNYFLFFTNNILFSYERFSFSIWHSAYAYVISQTKRMCKIRQMMPL